MANEKNLGYFIAEPPIYEPLNWDLDLIVKCLEVLRHKIPAEFKQLPKSLEYDLLRLRNPHGLPYPVIGMYTPIEEDWKKIPDWFEFYDTVEKWIKTLDLDDLKAAAAQLEVLTWDELEKQGKHPKR